MTINSISDFRKAMRHGPYAWPGGYPLYFVLHDGESLSFKAARENVRSILRSLVDPVDCGGWRPVAFEINWEDSELRCVHTGERIESAYGEETRYTPNV
jgi:hypothetical protein